MSDTKEKRRTASSPKGTSILSRLSQLQGSEKGGIILDIGSAYTRIGVSGEVAPKFIIPSKAYLQQDNKFVWLRDVDRKDVSMLRKVLKAFVRDIYLKHLLVQPKDHRVIVLEDLASHRIYRETLASVLFKDFKVPYGVFMPNHLACLFTIGRQSALVVRVGCSETSVLPISEGIPVVAGWQYSSVGALDMHRSVLKNLQQDGCLRNRRTGEEQPGSSITAELLAKDIENIVVRTCFVRSRTCEEVPPAVEYPLTGGEQIVSVDGRTRAFSFDVFYEPEEGDSIAQIILESLKRCPVDCRLEFSENILVVGGVVALPGFMSRLREELLVALSDPFLKYSDTLKMKTFKFHNPPSQPNCVEWLGGSIFGSQEKAVLERAVTMDSFLETSQLPDWMSCDPDQREKLHLSLPVKKSTTLSAGGSPRRTTSSSQAASSPKSSHSVKRDLLKLPEVPSRSSSS